MLGRKKSKDIPKEPLGEPVEVNVRPADIPARPSSRFVVIFFDGTQHKFNAHHSTSLNGMGDDSIVEFILRGDTTWESTPPRFLWTQVPSRKTVFACRRNHILRIYVEGEEIDYVFVDERAAQIAEDPESLRDSDWQVLP